MPPNPMSIPIRIPTPLRKLTLNQEVVEAEGDMTAGVSFTAR